MRNAYYLYMNRRSDNKLRQIYLVEGGIYACKMLVFLGGTSFFYFPGFRHNWLFVLPYIGFGVWIIFMNHQDNEYTGSKIFTIIDAGQFFLIALKMNDIIS